MTPRFSPLAPITLNSGAVISLLILGFMGLLKTFFLFKYQTMLIFTAEFVKKNARFAFASRDLVLKEEIDAGNKGTAVETMRLFGAR